MPEPIKRQPLLTAQVISNLHKAKRQIVDAAHGRVPEHLVIATMDAVERLGRQEDPDKVLPEQVLALVRASLKALAQQKWKPETALLLQKRLGEPISHG